VSGTVAAIFARLFGQNPRVVAAHLLVIAEWDLAVAAVLTVSASFGLTPRQIGRAGRLLLALTCLIQIWLYVLNAVSNLSWDRNMTAHLVTAFAPTIWSGKEPFPIGSTGIVLFACGALALAAVAAVLCGPALDRAAGLLPFV